MKQTALIILGSAILLAGCASTDNSVKSASASEGDTYVALGSNIPKKGSKRADGPAKTVDLQQLENDRTINNGTINPIR